jgi:hypothetical protein
MLPTSELTRQWEVGSKAANTHLALKIKPVPRTPCSTAATSNGRGHLSRRVKGSPLWVGRCRAARCRTARYDTAAAAQPAAAQPAANGPGGSLDAALLGLGEVALVVHAVDSEDAVVGDLEEGAAGEGYLVLAVDAAGVFGLLLDLHARLQL